MLCNNKTIKELLPAYQAQVLDQAANSEVERHLVSCPDCAEELALLGTLMEETVPDPGEAFWNKMPDRVYRALQQEKTNKRHFDLSWLLDRLRMPRWVFAAATVCVLLAVSLFVFRALQRESDTMISQSDLYSDSDAITAAGLMQMTALNQEEVNAIDTWVGGELFFIAQEAEPVLTGDRDTNLYEELAVLNSGEIDTLSRIINDLEEEA